MAENGLEKTLALFFVLFGYILLLEAVRFGLGSIGLGINSNTFLFYLIGGAAITWFAFKRGFRK